MVVQLFAACKLADVLSPSLEVFLLRINSRSLGGGGQVAFRTEMTTSSEKH